MKNSNPPRTYIIKSDWMKFEWPGGSVLDVAEVRVVLSDLALHFNAPLFVDGNLLGLNLASSEIGPISVFCEIMEERDLTDSEIDSFAFSFGCFTMAVGQATDLSALRNFVRDKFPSWARVCFYEDSVDGRPPVEPYCGPSAKS